MNPPAVGFRDDAARLLLGLLILALGVALAQLPLLWATALVIGGLGGLILLLRPAWGLVPLLLSVPLARLGGMMAGGMRISPAEVVLAGVLLAWLAQMAARRQIRFPHPPLLLPFLLLLGAMLLSLLGVLSLRAALKELIKWGSMIAAYLFVAARVERRHLGWLMGAILAAGCGQALLGIYQFLTGRGPEWFLFLGRFMRAYGTFEQPNPYGGYLGLTIPLALALALNLRTWLERLAAIAAGLPMVVALAMSWSRGAWLGFAAAVLILCLAHSRRTAILTGAATGFLILALVLNSVHLLPPVLAQRFAGLSAYFTLPDVTTAEVTEANYALIERLAHWQAAVRMWTDRPWLGVGIGNYAVVYPAYGLPHWPKPLGHAHNYYLNVGAETGLVGLVFYLIFCITAFWQALRAICSTSGLPRAVALGTLGALVHLGVHNLFDNLYVHTMYLQVAILLGLLAVIRGISNEGRGTGNEQQVARNEGPVTSSPRYSLLSPPYPIDSSPAVNPRWARLLELVIANRKEVDRFLKFSTVGAIGAVVDFGTLNLLILTFGLAKVWANTCSFSLAVCSNFLWNRLWTYPETRGDPILPQLGQFALVNLIGLGINQAIFLSLDRWAFAGWGPLGYNLAKAIATGVVLFWNFGVNRVWTYRHV